jgi:hypothetical protein
MSVICAGAPVVHFYNSDDFIIRLTAASRQSMEGLYYKPLAIGSRGRLLLEFERLLSEGAKFKGMLFETHGAPGLIVFGRDSITADWWRSIRAINCARLLKPGGRVYFNGCAVAAQETGWKFLEAAASVLLGPGGGEVFGHTSDGYANPFNGHVIHFLGRKPRRVVADPSGGLRRIEA